MTDAHIFQLLGLAYFAAGLGVLLNTDFYKKLLETYAGNPPLVYITGFIVLVVGYLLVAFHNIWTLKWSILITLVGWIALIKGMFMLVLPNSFAVISKALKRKKELLQIEAAIIAIIGLWFMYLGYFVV